MTTMGLSLSLSSCTSAEGGRSPLSAAAPAVPRSSVPRVLCQRSLALGITALSLLLICPGAILAAQGQPEHNPHRPANFLILVDTSGSMVGYYQRRDPRPCLALELVQSLVTETMAQGDRLVLLSFDHEIHDKPGETVALAPVDPGAALKEIEKLNLQTRPGYGTVRTAALGRGVKALQSLAQSAGRFSGGVVYLVTDRDEDRVPVGSRQGALRLRRLP